VPLKKVSLEFDDEIWIVEGDEAEKWDKHQTSISLLAQIHGMNPFQNDPINWFKTKKGGGK
jgi:hypothetical protein